MGFLNIEGVLGNVCTVLIVNREGLERLAELLGRACDW